MEHNKQRPIEQTNSSSRKFGVSDENQFLVSGDGKHVIGVDATDGSKLIFENIENGKADKFGWSRSSYNFITTLLYDDKTGILYRGDVYGKLQKYKIDTKSKTSQKVKNYGNLWIGRITSSYRFLDFVFFGGSWGRIRVLDLSTDELFSGDLDTSINRIFSLQVCVKSHKEIYLTVFGRCPEYSDDKTDLFDVSGLLRNDPVILQKYLSEHSINHEEAILYQPRSIKSKQDTTQNLTKEKDSY